MQAKTKQQQSRLSANVRQAKINRADLKKSASNNKSKAPPVKAGGASSLLKRIFGRADKPQTAQQSIPYREMYRDGICRVNDRLYTKTIEFQDINYQLAQNDAKTQIFEGLCDFINYFDSSIPFQELFTNRKGGVDDFQRAIEIPAQGDGHDNDRDEYSGMLKNQLAKGNNGIRKTKYVTLDVEADSLKEAKMRLERIEIDTLNNFKALGVKARPMTGKERLELMHGIFNPRDMAKFSFDWSDIAKTGLSTKDFIAPTSFDFRDGKTFRMGDTYGAVSFMQITASELTDRMLADFLDMDIPITVSLHIRSIDQTKAIKNIKRKLSDLDKMKIEEQKKAVRSGYDMDIIPTDLATYGREAASLLEALQSRDERMFLVTFLVMNTANTKRELDNNVMAAAGIAQKYNCALKRLDFQQEQGLMSCLPLGLNQVEIQRVLTTGSTAIFVPFTTQELFMEGEALYYGLNALSNNLIMANRKELKNPNGLFLGTPGCLVGETRIQLANGGTISLAELVESGVEKIEIKAFDETTRQIVNAPAFDMRISKKTDKLKNLFLDDGSIISCTDKHLILASNGEYVCADDITDGHTISGGRTVIRVSVTNLPNEIPVYDITVPHYFNFILDNGVIVHNSGKSFAAKREIMNVFLLTKDDIIISDPEAEYFPLVNRLGGQVIKLSPAGGANEFAHHINPMDINANYSDEDDPLTLKSDFILSLCELIVGGKDGLQPVEKTIIDRCVRLVYRDYLANPDPAKMPILQDLYNQLRAQSEPEAQRIATALEIYVTGSLNVFNHRTNVDINNRLVCYDIKELGKSLKKIAMLILQDAVWGRVTANRAAHKTTWFYQDELHLLLKEEQTAAFTVEVWKRFRKWGAIPSGLTQNVKDLLASREIENIFENSDFIYMLNQAKGDQAILAKQLGISPHQLSYVTQANAGEGLLFFGNTIIPFVDRFPTDTEIYSLLTTKPSEVQEVRV